MNFVNFSGQEKAKLALLLNAIDPKCGGVLLFGGRGSGKSQLIKLAEPIFRPYGPWIKMPLNALEETLLDSVDLEGTITSGGRIIRKGLLSRAEGGVLALDDINLVDNGLLSLIFSSPDFILLAAMNSEDAPLSPHYLDRIGFGVELSTMNKPDERLKILKAIRDDPDCKEENPQERIAQARHYLPSVMYSADHLEYAAELTGKYASPGHRGMLFLWHGAKALAAYHQKPLSSEHIDQVAELVFYHRSYAANDQEPEDQPSPEQTEEEQPDKNSQENNSKNRDAPGNDMDYEEPRSGELNSANQSQNGAGREEIMKTGAEFKIRSLRFTKDRLKRTAHGRRTKTKSRNPGGRHLKSVNQPIEKDISLEATLRAAAPFQKLRGRDGMLIIEKSDFRYKRKERRMGHLVLFVVDGSGSMGAKERMVETKGAVKSILMDCYQKRDQVAMICFRKNEARQVLPPTSSVELAARRLAEMPVGGKTPLAHGLLEAYQVVRRHKIKKPETRFIITLITDGRANQSVAGGKIQEEVENMLTIMADLEGCDFIVVDTENKKNFLRRDLAPQMAAKLGADYYTIESLQHETLSAIIQSSMAA